jgi:hypothetical protein
MNRLFCLEFSDCFFCMLRVFGLILLYKMMHIVSVCELHWTGQCFVLGLATGCRCTGRWGGAAVWSWGLQLSPRFWHWLVLLEVKFILIGFPPSFWCLLLKESGQYYLLSINNTFRCSFDVVRDQLGLVRSEFPHTFYGVAGTQVVLIFMPSKPRHCFFARTSHFYYQKLNCFWCLSHSVFLLSKL